MWTLKMSLIKTGLTNLLSKHLLLTNVVACGTLSGLGDYFIQNIEKAFQVKEYDSQRTGRMVMIGCALGPFNHYWYSFLDRVLVGKSGKVVICKILFDQTIASTFNCTIFLCGMSLLEGQGLAGAERTWKEKFLMIYLMDWSFWPTAQMINFRYIPSKLRVLYISICSLFWVSLLSYIKHRED